MSEQVSHTPGPWAVNIPVNPLTVIHGKGSLLATCYEIAPTISHEEAVGNARLFAAALDLYDALEALLAAEKADPYEIVGKNEYGYPVNAEGAARSRARKAIAKARGE